MTADLKNVIFDLDGTLIDSADDICLCLGEAYRQADIPLTVTVDRRFIGPPLPEMIRAISPGIADENVRGIVKNFRHRYMTSALRRTVLRRGIPALLDMLRAAGIRRFIVTNKPLSATRRIVRQLHIDDFDGVMGPDAASIGGTDKSGMIGLLGHQYGFTAGDTLMVGDSAQDISAAGRHGIAGIALLDGYGNREDILKSGPAYLVNRVDELPGLFTSVLATAGKGEELRHDRHI